jgi:phospholipid transport system substrate-binding protein
MDWRLGVSDGHYKIEDVAIDGVSMVLTERSEIAAQIASYGGQLQTLLATMRGASRSPAHLGEADENAG